MFNARASGRKYRRCTAIGPMYNLALWRTLSDSFIGFETARGRARLNRVGWQFFLVPLCKTVCSNDLPFQRFLYICVQHGCFSPGKLSAARRIRARYPM
jgi:hypothetical protein